MADKDDSQRAWELLLDRLRAIERAEHLADEADAEAWREYRRKCESYDKALATLKADIETVRLLMADRQTRTPLWQRAAWAVGTALAALILSRLGVDIPALVSLLAGK